MDTIKEEGCVTKNEVKQMDKYMIEALPPPK
jgi:hypothetical protein